jgi:hypothetical protein
MIDGPNVGNLREPTGHSDQIGRVRTISHETLGGGDLPGQRVRVYRCSWLNAGQWSWPALVWAAASPPVLSDGPLGRRRTLS